ncbi:phosphoinositide 3-kinase regulatory subunit 4 [Euwallacea similis]|uniref:phosphoinositide 3-kinase regulatory subunit 4 n=1 Tax=Euwallacea similis TaxID=1736056 RepID=UPI00344DD0CD
MGNQQAAMLTPIHTVEWYLKEHQEITFDKSLGSTRFLKVARVHSQEGPLVAKLFIVRDPTLPLQVYKDRLEEIRKLLSTAVNCSPYQRFIITDKAALFMREYVKYSLYDRISTRPFLTDIEKRWITFQILYALHQCHKVGVCHGDIKLENITVTSWNWVMLVDFASFKPTFLPIDNPGDYSYFFDTSRRRTCYIAPERFLSSANLGTSKMSAVISETLCESGDLNPSMDIFSAGCALLELWNELHFPFDYSQLLAYRSGKYSPQKHLDRLEDLNLRNLIASMIDREPAKRLSAEDYLDLYRGTLFPQYFYTFLQSYMLIFSSNPILSADEKIIRLKGDIANIFKFLGPVRKSPDDLDSEDEDGNEKRDVEKYEQRGECEGLVLITSLVTSCIRGLHESPSKLFSLEILLELAQHASDETILDRILPYLMYLAHDSNSRVKIFTINTITKCLNLVQRLPRSDANVFPEYILPELAQLATDPNACVRAAYARNINDLAEIALRYLDQIQNIWYGEEGLDKTDNEHMFNYELELQALQEMVQQTVSALLTDTHSIVKQALLNSGIHKLCIFFGKAIANDIILSHMITFLNDKEDTQLRKAFFDSIVGVSSYIGWHCLSILTPLLLLGLTDSSEFVIRKAIIAMASLTEFDLVTTSALCELIIECSYFLVHPNLWIREAVCGFVAKAGRKLSILDVQCKVMPHLQLYMKHKLIQIDKSELLLDSLVSPIPRVVYDNVIKDKDISQIMEELAERKHTRDCIKSGMTPHYDGLKQVSNLRTLFSRLEANGMTEEVEEYLLKMRDHLQKIQKHRSSLDAKLKKYDGKTDMDSHGDGISVRKFTFSEANKSEFVRAELPRTSTMGSVDINVHSDWNYGSEVSTRQSESTNSRPSSPPPDNQLTQFVSTTTDASSLHEKSFIQCKPSTCQVELNKLKAIQQNHYYEALRNREWAEQAAWKPQLPPPGWHPRGILVAHLHEHKAAVVKLCRVSDTSFFASGSTDGTIRFWDCSSFENNGFANRSRQQFRLPNTSPATGLAVCDGGQSLAASCHNGWMGILRIDSTSSKMNVLQHRQLDQYDEGLAVDLQCLDPGTHSTVVYATLYGDLVGWDLRAPGVSWRLSNGVRQGVITTFCLDTHQNWLALGTSDGVHTLWDLRFRLPITTISLPTSGSAVRIRKVIPHPTENSWLISSVQGNNEISMWNLESGSRQKVLWGSTTPPLSKLSHANQQTSHSVCAMYASYGCIDRSPFLLSGGTDQRLRFWNLASPSESYLALPAAGDPLGTTLSYRSRLIDGTDVVYEESANTLPKDKTEDVPRGGPESPPAGHKDCISDIILCKGSQYFTITASRDGVIKVSK